jgi:hypothetical protein
MTRAPLKVRSRAANASPHDLDVTDLTFSQIALGGYSTASFTIPQYVNSTDVTVRPLSQITVYDVRTGGTVWQGYLDLPDKNAERSGQTWQIDATGPMQLLSDTSLPYIMIDKTFAPWEQLYASNAGFTAGPNSSPADDDVDAVVLQMSNGIAVDIGSKISARYSLLEKAGQNLGGYGISHIEGIASTAMRFQVLTRPTGGSYTAWTDVGWTTGTVTNLRGAGTFGTSEAAIAIRLYRASGSPTTISNDLWWSAATTVRVKALQTNQAGAAITTTGYYDPAYVLAHQVVTDALWRYTTMIDIPNSSIDTTFSNQIDQMVYPDPVRLTDILNDLVLLESDMIYEVLERVSGAGHQFNLRKWPTDVRYEATMVDGWRQTGGEADYRNRILVSGTDERGRPVVPLQSIATVPELEQWNRLRDADPIELGYELWSNANAVAVATGALDQINEHALSGTLTVARPIRDLYLGRHVWPWEIQPGYNINIRGLDGGSVLRIQERAYNDQSCAASLTIGQPVLTTDQLVNQLHKARPRAAIGK